MKIALSGYGRMGRAVEAVALERGHRIGVWGRPGREGEGRTGLAELREEGAEVVVDFSVPSAVVETVEAAARASMSVAVGTTGWYHRLPEVTEVVETGGIGLIWAPNFSLGVQAFFRMVRRAARLVDGLPGYDAYLGEVHHRHKLDHPSGTARRLTEILLAELSEKERWAPGPGEGPADPDTLQVTSVRAGENPGSHSVVFEGPHDRIELTHGARGREGFAAGAVEAAEWIVGRTGIYTLDEMLESRFGAEGGGSDA